MENIRRRLSSLISITLFVLLTFLVACTTTRPGDGLPRGGSNVPREMPDNAIPRDEPRSRYGNGPDYKVFGKSYKVLNSSHGYQERGVASWYGKKFHGRMTSNQEPYDMYAMTAAHKSLPLPTYVRVRNLKNNRSVVVRVNDRGPFVDNRLIDLSYSAALKLDMVRDGTGLVEVTAISFDSAGLDKPGLDNPDIDRTAANALKSRTANTPAKRAHTPAEKVFVQVGAFGDSANAQRRFRLLKNNGFQKAFVHEDRQQSPTLYRVRIGPIASVSQYDALVNRLRDIGIAEAHLISD